MEHSLQQQKESFGFQDSDVDDVRRLISDTNVYLLIVTLLASTLHLLFEVCRAVLSVCPAGWLFGSGPQRSLSCVVSLVLVLPLFLCLRLLFLCTAVGWHHFGSPFRLSLSCPAVSTSILFLLCTSLPCLLPFSSSPISLPVLPHPRGLCFRTPSSHPTNGTERNVHVAHEPCLPTRESSSWRSSRTWTSGGETRVSGGCLCGPSSWRSSFRR